MTTRKPTRKGRVSPKTAADGISVDQRIASEASKLIRILPHKLLPNESEHQYTLLRRHILDVIAPRDMIEVLWTKDFVDAAFDIERLKRLKTALVSGHGVNELKHFLSTKLPSDPVDGLSAKEAAERFVNEAMQSPSGRGRIASKLAEYAVDENFNLAVTYQRRHEDIVNFEKLITHAERKRDRLMKQISDYRHARSVRPPPPVIELTAEEVDDDTLQ